VNRLVFLLLAALTFSPVLTAAQERGAPDREEVRALAALRTLKELTPRLQKHSPAQRRAIYLAVAVERGLLAREEAESFARLLGAVPGFDAAARQLCGGGSPARDGALYELRLARALAERGVRVVELRRSFRGDPGKKVTDIDVLVEHPRGAFVAIECKSGSAPTDSVNADAVTLQHYVAQHPSTRAAFSFLGAPTALARKLLEIKGILLLTGPPEEQVASLDAALSGGQ
jgi:Holliday junction resolvase-like predicted endonuclease